MPRLYTLRCRDPETDRTAYRRASFAFVTQSNPAVIAGLVVVLATNIMRSWPTVYGVGFPYARAEWDVVTTTEAARL